MIEVKLTIIYKKIQRMNETSFEENIADFMTRIISQNKVLIQKSVSLMFLDSKYRLLSLSSKVPNKLLVLAIDIKNLYERNVILRNKYNIKELEQFIYKVQTILNEKKEQKTPIVKEKFQINKEEFKQVIKPAVIKKEKENEITKPSILRIQKEQDNKPAKKINKSIVSTKYSVLKKKDIKIIKFKNKDLENIKRNLHDEKKTIINKPKEKKPLKIQMTVKLKKDKSPVVIILKKDKLSIPKEISPKKDKPSIPIEISPNKDKVTFTIKRIDKDIDYKDKSETLTMSNKQTENHIKIVEEKKHNEIISPIKKEKIDNEPKIKNVEVMTDINTNKKRKSTLKAKVKQHEKVEDLKEQKIHLIKVKDKSNIMEKQEISLKKKETTINKIEEIIDEKKEKENQQSINYTILSPTNEVLYHVEIINEAPITVEEMLIQSGLEINNSNGFIESINGIENKGMSGWVFEVNNFPIMVSAAEYVINPSDQITWKYVDFSKMMEKDNIEKDNSKPLTKQNRKGKIYEKKNA